MYDKYLIKHGEDLKTIAKKFNTEESVILELNNIPFSDMIREGKEIIVPVNKEKYFEYYTIKQGDSLYAIGKKYNIQDNKIRDIILTIFTYLVIGAILTIIFSFIYYAVIDNVILNNKISKVKQKSDNI